MTELLTVTLPPDRDSSPDGVKAGGWWHQLPEAGRLICDLCPRECNLRPGDRGFCFVRQNVDGRMFLTTYGHSTGFCIDPIEKKPLNHFYPGTSVLSFGTAGCNLGCKFCQNHDISKAREVELLSEQALPEVIARAAAELGCRSVAYTYNDPVIWAEYAIETARACRQVGVKSVAVTAGYITPAARAPFFEHFDAANVDLKAFTEEFYQHLTLAHIQPVLETLEWLKKETDVWIEITNLIIPDANDSQDELLKLCDWVLEHVGDAVPVHFTAFHPDFQMTDRRSTPHETLVSAYDLARQAGLQYVYVGNVNDLEHQSTYCPSCGKVVIQRDWYQLGSYHLEQNRCVHCQHVVAGHFDIVPGTWGRRRQPVQISRFATTPSHAAETEASPTDSGASARCGGSRAFVPSTALRTAGVATVNSQRTTAAPSADFDLSPEQRASIHRAACELVAAAVTGQPIGSNQETLRGVRNLRVMGAYVSVKRRGMLRGCCGFIGSDTALPEAIEIAAKRTATEDIRMPAISASELPYLDVEVWLLQGLIEIFAQGASRADEIVVGRDGLHIASENSRGLLLPGVATDNGWDAEYFLRQVCIKAGLPATAWKNTDTALHRFEGESIKGAFDSSVLDLTTTTSLDRLEEHEFNELASFCRQNVGLMLRGAVPNYYLPSVPDGMVHGVALTISRKTQERTNTYRISLRPPFPMQSTLFSLCETAARTLSSQGGNEQDLANLEIDVTILDDPAMHGTGAQPDLRGLDPERRALLAVANGRSAWRFSPSESPNQILKHLSDGLGQEATRRAGLYSLRVLSTRPSIQVVNVPRPQAGAKVRSPAVAGHFYPADAVELRQAVDNVVPEQAVTRRPWRAALVPHAGLRFSGRIAAEVLARVQIPELIIVIGPKHTNLGVDWAVAPHQTWALPGIELASDIGLADELIEAIPGLEKDALAHQKEHAIEVELPLIHRFAPHSKVVGVAIGTGDLASCRAFASGMAKVLRRHQQRILLLISSDMNHFATETENRRLDKMAIEAITTLNPDNLYRVVRDNAISMCGVLPAVIAMETLNELKPLETAQQVAYGTSADVSGDTSRVVGYAGMLFD